MIIRNIDKLEGIYNYDELKDLGIKCGDIIAYSGNEFECGICWNYVLLMEDFPKNFNVALCCYKDVRDPERMYLYKIGFKWFGKSLNDFHFRVISEEERKEFIDCCISELRKPFNFWDEDIYSQILNSLIKYGLISKYKGNKLNKELKELHGIDLLNFYRKNYR